MRARRVFFTGSQLLGTLPAPLFLFLAGISFALVTDKLIRKGLTPAAITRTMARRGAEILAFGLLFRLQEFLIAWGWAPWSDLLRVDVLNIIGLSMILMALLCGFTLTVWRKTSDSRQEMSQSVSRWRAALVIAVYRRCRADRLTHAASPHNLATKLAALAAGILHQWMP